MKKLRTFKTRFARKMRNWLFYATMRLEIFNLKVSHKICELMIKVLKRKIDELGKILY